MNLESVAIRLRSGDPHVIFRASGNSMEPKIRNGDEVAVVPLGADDSIGLGDIVLARVRGRWYLHLVSGLDGKRVKISNNKGRANGWTTRANVVGIFLGVVTDG